MKEKTISQRFQVRLAIIVIIALTVSTLFIFVLNSGINTRNYQNIILSTLDDIEKDIEDTSDISMLELTARAKERAQAILSKIKLANVRAVNNAFRLYAAEEELSEMNVVSTDNIIIYSNMDEYIGFDMNINEDTRAFEALNHGEAQVVQPVRLNAYSGEGSYDLYNKYAGLPLEGFGYVQVGINSARFQKQVDEKISYIAANRHIGQTGYVIISNLNDVIVSNAGRVDETNMRLADIGLKLDDKTLNTAFTGIIDGVPHMCVARFVEGYYIIGVVPDSEVQSFRNRAAITNTITEVVIFALMFLCIYGMIHSLIVSKIHNVNGSLNKIIEGDLNTIVNEYSTKEFAQLSNDINSTVKSLKAYTEREKEKIKQELEFAKNIQMSALPKINSLAPYRSSFELYATMNTAKEVGGDFYDFYMLDESRLAVLVADVSGKGVPAAMFMMNCKAMLKNLSESGLPLDEVFNKANEELCNNNDAGMFVTVWMGILDLKTGHMEYVSAGHNPPLFYDESGKFAYLQCKPGFVLTGMPGLKYRVQTLELKPGDKFFLYTDGVTEAINPNKEMYGEERLLAYLNASRNESLSAILLGLKADIDRFAEEAEQFDDITMVGVCYS